MDRFRASRIRPACAPVRAGGVGAAETLMVGDSVIDWRTARAPARDLPGALRIRVSGFPHAELRGDELYDARPICSPFVAAAFRAGRRGSLIAVRYADYARRIDPVPPAASTPRWRRW